MLKKLSFILLNLVFFVSLSSFAATEDIQWGLSARQGDRQSMEDTHVHITQFEGNPQKAFFAVYDGHGGNEAADFSAQNLHVYFSDALKNNDSIEESLKIAFQKTDDNIQKAGAVAAVAYINNDDLYIAWAGDTRAVVIRDNNVIFATEDHKPNAPEELKRITLCGGTVTYFGVPRINGLAIARALGDKKHKKLTPGAIIATPEIAKLKIKKNDSIILACDGVWDVLQNCNAYSVIKNALEQSTGKLEQLFPKQVRNRNGQYDYNNEEDGNNDHLMLAARTLRDTAYDLGSTDNISVIIIRL